jgi:peptidoglycan hydrolase-like protein with peptidoglycan-binding domain
MKVLSAAGLVIGLVVGSGAVACGSDADAGHPAGTSQDRPSTTESASTSTAAPSTSAAPPATEPSTTMPVPVPEPVPPEVPPPPAPTAALPTTDVGPGDRGPEVGALQHRLAELRFWVGPFDEAYGHLVRQAMYAFEKANGLPVDGVLSGDDHAALATTGPVVPQSGADSGRLIEVDKSRQLLLLVDGGQVVWAFNAASGTEQEYWHPTDGLQVADTPVGRHEILFALDELEDGKMGLLYRPRYFHGDAIAVHGDDVVPPAPVSHGCVRISRQAMDMVWDEDLAPIGSPVLVYGESPPPWPGA